MNYTLLVAGSSLTIQLIWMVVTSRIEDRIGAKIDALKEWMEKRYVSTDTFEGFQEVLSVKHSELDRRVTKLEPIH